MLLKYNTTAEELLEQADSLRAEADWIGTPESAKYIISRWRDWPEDAVLYLLYSRPYKEEGDHIWNHGELLFAAISLQEGEILFYWSEW